MEKGPRRAAWEGDQDLVLDVLILRHLLENFLR